ncbi:hypothetical protein J1N35_030088 [Gossypium stocksii]|uniref:Uncharacterized protein n=1 Tax=Gossypium stocksii TaxID=47602 RepID=A0A9D3UZ58_9ROSI|nr:hypothetical protein J1N35_030088 [Gossypium stocksii]
MTVKCMTPRMRLFFYQRTQCILLLKNNIQLLELHGIIRRKIFGSNQMRVLSLKYRFCTSIDPVRYDAFDIRGMRGLEAMVQMHIDSESPFLELYA